MRITIGQLVFVLDERRVEAHLLTVEQRERRERARQTTRRIRRISDLTMSEGS